MIDGSEIDSIFDDRSIRTGLDDSKIVVLPNTSNDLVLDGSRLESTLVNRLIISVLDGNTTLADGIIGPILNGSEAVLLDTLIDLYGSNDSVPDGSKLASILICE